MKKKTISIIQWVLAVSMALIGIAFMPSFASLFAFLFAVICVPIRPLQAQLKKIKVAGLIKAVVLVVLFVVAFATIPVDNTSQNAPASETQQIEVTESQPSESSAAKTETPEPSESPEVTVTPSAEPSSEPTVQEVSQEPSPAKTQSQQPEASKSGEKASVEKPATESKPVETTPAEPEPTPEPTPEPEPEPTPEPEPEPPAQEVTTIHGLPSNTTVYVSNSGKIHSISNCSGMKNYREMTLGEAEAKGYEYCKNCW